jgi:hypothetical protein
MGDYEELCEQFGLSPSSDEDYEALTDILVNGTGEAREQGSRKMRDSAARVFLTFQEASEWSRANNGHPFTRTADGNHFAPVKSNYIKSPPFIGSSKDDLISDSWSIKREAIQAFLKGEAAPNTDWLPGTYLHIGSDRTEPEIDSLNEKQFFLPRLELLAPDIAKLAKKYKFATYGFYQLMSCRHHQMQTVAELLDLLDLLKGKLVRSKRWYTTQSADSGINKVYDVLPSFFESNAMVWAYEQRHGKIPKELCFWQGAVDIVQREVDKRVE